MTTIQHNEPIASKYKPKISQIPLKKMDKNRNTKKLLIPETESGALLYLFLFIHTYIYNGFFNNVVENQLEKHSKRKRRNAYHGEKVDPSDYKGACTHFFP